MPTVSTVVAGRGITVDATDASNPIVNSAAPGNIFNVADYGAVADAQENVTVAYIGDGSVANSGGFAHVTTGSGSPAFVNATAPAGDIGKTIWVTVRTAPGITHVKPSLITAVNSAHEVTTDCPDTDSTPVASGAHVHWGTDSTAAFIAAFDAAVAANVGGTIRNTIAIDTGCYMIKERWYNYGARDIGGPNVVGGDGLATLYVSPDISVDSDHTEPVFMKVWSFYTIIKNLYCDGTGRLVAFQPYQAFIDFQGQYLNVQELTVANIAGDEVNSYQVRYLNCKFLTVRGGGTVATVGFSATDKDTRPVQFIGTNGNVYDFRTSNMRNGGEISLTPGRGGLNSHTPLNFFGCFFDETAGNTCVYLKNGGEANFYGCLLWGRGEDDTWALAVETGANGPSKAWLFGCNVGVFQTALDITAKAMWIGPDSLVHAQGCTIRCASPSGQKICVDNSPGLNSAGGLFYDDGGNNFQWGNSSTLPPGVSVDITPDTVGGKSVMSQVFADPTRVVRERAYDPTDWAKERFAEMKAVVPGLTGHLYTKFGELGVGTAAGFPATSASHEGGAVAAGTGWGNALSGPLFMTPKTGKGAICWQGVLMAPASGKYAEFALQNGAPSHGVYVGMNYAVSTTKWVMEIIDTAETSVVSSVNADGNLHNFMLTFDGTRVSFYVDNVQVCTTTTLTHLNDEAMQAILTANDGAAGGWCTQQIAGFVSPV